MLPYQMGKLHKMAFFCKQPDSPSESSPWLHRNVAEQFPQTPCPSKSGEYPCWSGTEHLQEVIFIVQSIWAECLCELHLNLNHIVIILLLLDGPVSAADAKCYLQQPWNHAFISHLMQSAWYRYRNPTGVDMNLHNHWSCSLKQVRWDCILE